MGFAFGFIVNVYYKKMLPLYFSQIGDPVWMNTTRVCAVRGRISLNRGSRGKQWKLNKRRVPQTAGQYCYWTDEWEHNEWTYIFQNTILLRNNVQSLPNETSPYRVDDDDVSCSIVTTSIAYKYIWNVNKHKCYNNIKTIVSVANAKRPHSFHNKSELHWLMLLEGI